MRFDFYAFRVRVFGTIYSEGDGPPHRAQELLDELRAEKGAPLLPNLRSASLRIQSISSRHEIAFITAVAPPSLSEFALTLPASRGEPLVDQIRPLAASCPTVTQATFYVDRASADIASLAAVIELWPSLRTFALRFSLDQDWRDQDTVMDRQLLQALAMNPSIENLEFDLALRNFRDPIYSTNGQSLNPVGAFKTLRKLGITADNTAILQAVLDDISSPTLQELNVSTGDTQVVAQFPQYLEACTLAGTLKRLTIASRPWPGLPNTTTMSAYHILPLKNLHRLQHLDLYLGHSYTYVLETSDDDWAILASSWPRLQTLCVHDGKDHGSPPSVLPTYRALVHLARHCRELCRVVMTIIDTMPSSDSALPDALLADTQFLDLRLRVLTILPGDERYSYRSGTEQTQYFADMTWEQAMELRHRPRDEDAGSESLGED